MRTIAKFLLRNRGFIAFMLCMVVFRSAVADRNVVPTGSMQPTIRIGDRILVDKLARDVRLPLTHVSLLHLADPQRGDIVVLDSQAAQERAARSSAARTMSSSRSIPSITTCRGTSASAYLWTEYRHPITCKVIASSPCCLQAASTPTAKEHTP
ncbi:signal peptidase I [Rhodanobacter thiooxydans]|uniref:signal peptidase I n=1 Tax=Rhodanobacter thiooxydans TaxID=416169 RepID=UPI000260C484|nr:signal peptidase I [Rhodanobacter thiooxydans]EIM02368.1 signal peptidase I [Rhodanobacter thiooxydans LCS2]